MKVVSTTHPLATRLLALIALLALTLGLSVARSPAPAHAADPVVGELGGTIVLRISDEFYEFHTSRNGSFAREGLAQTLPGDLQTFLLPITFVNPDPNATVGWAAPGSGITFTYSGAVAGTIGDLSEADRLLRPSGLFTEFRRGIDVNCSIIQQTVDLTVAGGGGAHTWAARHASWAPRLDQEDAIGCYMSTHAPFALHPDMFLVLDDPRYEGIRVNYWTFSLRPPLPFAGFLAPVDNAPVENEVKAGSAVPVRFSLGGNHGLNILATGSPSSQPTTCSAGASTDPVSETVNAGNSSLSYDAASDTYTYVWKTNKGWKGCRELTLWLVDSNKRMTKQTLVFKFK